ncbi:dCMP deaminase [Thermotomaculum hydrothermale]|uniref:dCMP deaminase n=1 Tax=Thermotomaculum hydrothermale TaxID=981385 RepID=A0A7R6PRP5_9BACT|nr:cytidine/deoxycytidylate deaminase family protein [Thermotomaculum hydrothermale]BBB33101.1 dCMP deaminase [Thermotomaculum hydrothermale]
MSRPGWDEYFIELAYFVARRSTCTRRQVGAVIVKDKHILATGYNGAPKGIAHCLDTGCLRDKLGIPSGTRHEICMASHAEQNAIIQAAYHGIAIKDAVIYCTTHPCSICAKMIINAGIKKIYYVEGYPDELGKKLLDEAGIERVKLTNPERVNEK